MKERKKEYKRSSLQFFNKKGEVDRCQLEDHLEVLRSERTKKGRVRAVQGILSKLRKHNN